MNWLRLACLVPALLSPAAAHAARAAAGGEKTVCVVVTLKDGGQPEGGARPAPPADTPAPADPGAAPAPAPPATATPAPAGDLTDEQRDLVDMVGRRNAARQQVQALRAQAQAPAGGVDSMLPVGQTPVDYLKRLLEHFVTHEPGFVAVPQGCEERLEVELYPLREGWTAFARLSSRGREERVDQLFPDELSQYAERAARALLYDRPISSTILRDTVLRSDSRKSVQRIRGTNHFGLGLGTMLRVGQVPTVQEGGGTAEVWRVFSPMSLSAFYRGKFESWGVETGGQLGIGTSRTGVQQNTAGGHVDYGGNLALNLHFLRYTNPRGLTSFYVGAGSTFEMLWLYAIRAPGSRTSSSDRDTLFSGGLDVDLLLGFEFMRASRAQFFLQGELHVPAYMVENGDSGPGVRTYLPGLSVKLGMLL